MQPRLSSTPEHGDAVRVVLARRSVWICALLATVVLLLIAPLAANTKPGWAFEESAGLDTLFKFRGHRAPIPGIVIVGISPESSKAINRPRDLSLWNRDVYSQILNAIRKETKAPMAIDIVFDSARTTPGDSELAETIQTLGNIALVADTSHQPPSVLMPAFSEVAVSAPFPVPVHRSRVRNRWRIYPVGPGVPTLANVAATLMLMHEMVVPTDFASPTDAVGLQSLVSNLSAGTTVTKIAQGNWSTLSGPDQTYFNFYGPPGSFTFVSLEALLANDHAATARLRSARVVLLGRWNTSHINQEDAFHTVFGGDRVNLTPGVELLATAIANELEGSSITPPSTLQNVAILFSLGLICLLLIFLSTRVSFIAGILIVACAYHVTAILMFGEHAQWIPFATPTLLVFLPALLLGLLWHYLDQRSIRLRLGRAIDMLLPGGHRVRFDQSGQPSQDIDLREQVCLATDLAGFTSLAESASEQYIAKLTNEYFKTLGQAIEEHGGRSMDIAGDATTNYWDVDNNGILRACAAALTIAAFERDSSQTNSLKTRIGIHVGNVARTGSNVGSRFYYRATGDATNTACRLESLNKVLGTRILISAAVNDHLTDIPSRAVGRFQLAGHSRAMPVYELGYDLELPCESLSLALRALQDNRLDDAANHFRVGLEASPSKVIKFYVDLLAGYSGYGRWNTKERCVQMSKK